MPRAALTERTETRAGVPLKLDASMAAVAFRWESTAVGDLRSMAALRRRLERLCAVGVHVAVLSDCAVSAVAARLGARPGGSGRLLLLSTTEGVLFTVEGARLRPLPGARRAAPATMTRVLDAFVADGVGSGLVLVVGAEFGAEGPDAVLLVPELARATVVSVGPEPAGVPAGVWHVGGGEAAFRALLDEQLRRRERRRVGVVDADPAWIVRETGTDPLRHRVTETLFTLGAGGVATRGAVEEPTAGSVPRVLAAGIYTGTGHEQHLLPGPGWTAMSVQPAPVEDVRTLDLRTGVLLREELRPAGPPLRSLRFASVTRPGVVALRAESALGRLRPGPPLAGPRDVAPDRFSSGRVDGLVWASAGDEAGICAVATQHAGRDGAIRAVERIAAYTVDERGAADVSRAHTLLVDAAGEGFDRLLTEQRAAWAARWDRVDVRIPDDPAAELAIRFALFQLWCNTTDPHGGAGLAVGARGLSGPGYAGHVFWDADVFVLPALLTMNPSAARAMVRYRLHRLPAAQARARASGFPGARFPWESAATGDDVTPTSAVLGGRPVPILTGRREEHVTADVAWAATRVAEWIGDTVSSSWPGFPLLVETARYWAARCRHGPDGRAHIDDVIGPDEYHEHVDDNAFTNVMARWNLRAAADAAAGVADLRAESERWRAIAAELVDGYDPATQRYEQFAGYFGLEPLRVADYAEPPVAADMLLGRERVSASQLIKQPDVLMLHHLLPDEVAPGSLTANLDFYDQRTAHGSSLSPSVTASLLARGGRADEALAMLRIALALDLDDLTATTAAGLHLANLGGVWQAVLTGFAGIRVRESVLHIDPQLPGQWSSLQLRLHALGRWVRLDLRRDSVRVATDRPIRVQLGNRAPKLVIDRMVLPVDGGEA